MPSPQSRKSLRRTLLACGALFAVLFCLLAAQMVLGRDPAVGDGARTQTASAPAAGSSARDDGSWVDLALGVVRALASDDDEHGDDEDSGSSAPLQSRAS